MRDGYAHEYPPGEWTVDRVERSLRTADEAYELPTYADEHVWERLRDDDLTGPHVESILSDAADQRGEPVPPLPASTYLEFERTGERYAYQEPEKRRFSRLTLYALAECFEREGEYLDDVLDYAWAICEQTSWVTPAHLEGTHDHRGLPGAVDDEERVVELHSTWIASLLAEVDYLLGDRLHPALRERIRTAVDRRILTPYLARDDIWWLSPPTMNWNAVCNGAVMTAALHLLEDAERQARVIAKGCHSLEHYLASFDDDGCTAEGIKYWNYGFGHYVQIAATLEARTDGELSLFEPPIVEDIAEYPLKVEMSPGRYVPFSDGLEDVAISPGVVSRLGTEFDLEGLGALGRRVMRRQGPNFDFSSSMAVLRDLLWTRPVPTDWERPRPPRRLFFEGNDWWFARNDPSDPDGLVVVAKGGHNDEPHNHNDCGSVIVHYRGESLLTDLGRPDYDRDYFVDEHRYDYLAARSLGHSVPYVGGFEQAHGAEHAAAVVERDAGTERESLELELADCYPAAADLESLRRTVALRRGDPGRVTVNDRGAFASDASGRFESVLVSYFPMEAAADGLVVDGENGRATVAPDPADAEIEIERLPEAIKGRDVWRARIDPGETAADERSDVRLSLTVELEPR